MRVRFVIPNRDDLKQNPVIYQEAELEVVPRKGETVYLGLDEDSSTPWVVKYVSHMLVVPTMSDEPAEVYQINVRLIEPRHWSQQ